MRAVVVDVLALDGTTKVHKWLAGASAQFFLIVLNLLLTKVLTINNDNDPTNVPVSMKTFNVHLIVGFLID